MKAAATIAKYVAATAVKTLLITLVGGLYAVCCVFLTALLDWRVTLAAAFLLVAAFVFLIGWCMPDGRARKRTYAISALIAVATAIAVACASGIGIYFRAVTVCDAPLDRITLAELYAPFNESSDIARLKTPTDFGSESFVLHADPMYYRAASALVNAVCPSVPTDRYGANEYLDTVTYLSSENACDDVTLTGSASFERYYKGSARLSATVVAKDPLVFFTHKSNPVVDLSSAELASILTAETQNWKDAGGYNERIRLYTRHDVTAAADLISQKLGITVAQGETEFEFLFPFYFAFNRRAVSYRNVGGAIGFAFLSDIRRQPEVYSQTVCITIDGCSPFDADAVRSGRYPLVSDVIAVCDTTSENNSKSVKFMLSEDGRYLLSESGLIV